MRAAGFDDRKAHMGFEFRTAGMLKSSRNGYCLRLRFVVKEFRPMDFQASTSTVFVRRLPADMPDEVPVMGLWAWGLRAARWRAPGHGRHPLPVCVCGRCWATCSRTWAP